MNSDNTPQSILVRQLARMARLHAERRADPALRRALQRVADWQATRMGTTYSDLAAQPRYADAIAFFLSDLYGGADFAQRDADLARVVPIMTRMLPERVITTIGDATELNVVSHELDRSLFSRLPRTDGTFTVAEYCAAYRWVPDRPDRARQIGLIRQIGAGLDDYVGKPFIRSALAMMRGPASIAGVAVLHDFLERGFLAFRKMGGAAQFLATIDGREREIMASIYEGEDAPFPEPVLPEGAAAEAEGGHDAR